MQQYDDGIPERESPDGPYVPDPDKQDRFVEQILRLRIDNIKPKAGQRESDLERDSAYRLEHKYTRYGWMADHALPDPRDPIALRHGA